MRPSRIALAVGSALLVACSGNSSKDTLATLRNVPADTQDVQVEGGLDSAMQSYQRFLEETPESVQAPEAMRRLADLKIEKEYGLNGDGELTELPAPAAADLVQPAVASQARVAANVVGTPVGSEQDLEKRANAEQRVASGEDLLPRLLPEQMLPEVQDDLAKAGPLEAIQLYDRLLAKFPSHEHNDRVL